VSEEINVAEEARDTLARVVLDRYRRAKEYRDSYRVHQGRSFSALIERADHQFRREYTSEDAAQMEEAFGFTPTRYYGITQQKTLATVAWHNDLVVNNLDSMFTATPSPEPTIDSATRERIRAGVRESLLSKMQEAGLADPNMLLDAKGRPAQRIREYLQSQVLALRDVERARIVSTAQGASQRVQSQMRDLMLEGGFRQSYQLYTFDRCLYGMGVMRFPDFQRRPVLSHEGKSVKVKWKTTPWFRHVRLQDFYPVCDAIDTLTNSGNTEITFVTKAELIQMAEVEGYYKDQIADIIDDYAYRARNWVESDTDAEYWNLDDVAPLLIHEGFFSGSELAEHGITGIGKLDYVSARVEVCGWRTIRCSIQRMPNAAGRTYFTSPFAKIGNNLLDCIGLGSMLWDTEQRINRLMHLYEHNADWASRPPAMVNPSAFNNPSDAENIVPGGQYMVEDRFGASGSMPEPIRSMRTVSAQYHLLMSQVGLLLRQADEDCGIPAFAYGAQDFGRSSLGEYSQRMSNALRTIKQAALNEDIYFIEPGFKGLFQYTMEQYPDLREGQDVGLQVRGMTGLLREDATVRAMQSTAPAVINDQTGIATQEAKEYAFRQIMEQAGFPVDALGMANPIVDNAMAVAANQPLNRFIPGGAQIPELDGRSGVPAANVASPRGLSNAAIPTPSLGG
jgi:hypothetical protein